MFQTVIEAFIEKHRALLPEQCQEELRVLWSALTTAYQGEVIRSAKARQEIMDATEALKEKTAFIAALTPLRWGVFVKGTTGRAARVPIASFEYADMAARWAKYNYPGISEVRDITEEGATNGSKN